MDELIDALVKQTGVTTSQAEGGAAAILKAAHDKLGPTQFQELLGALPGVNALLAKAPASRGSLFGGFASMAGKLAGGNVAHAAQLLVAFSALGMNKGTAIQFAPVLLKFVETHGGPELPVKIRAALDI